MNYSPDKYSLSSANNRQEIYNVAAINNNLVKRNVKSNVLILCPFFPPNIGGAESHLAFLTDYLRKNGYYVTVITYKPLTTKTNNYLPHEFQENIEIHRVWWFGQSNNLFEKFTSIKLLQFVYMFPGITFYSFYYMIKHHREIDLVHSHGFIGTFANRIVTIFFKKRSIMTTHFIYDLNKNLMLAKIFNWMVRPSDKILVSGEKSANDLLCAGIQKDKIVVFNTWGIDPNLFKPLEKEDCRRKIGLEEKFIVLFVGRLIAMKGINVLLEVATKLPDVIFLFVGDGPLSDKLKIASQKSKNIRYDGKKTSSELVYYYGASDIVILPSQAEEAAPMVVIEALSCGRPVISTNKGGVINMINSEIGELIDPTVENISQKINFFYGHPEELVKMNKKCREYAVDRFGEGIFKRIVEIYRMD